MTALMEVPQQATRPSASTEGLNNGSVTQARYDTVVEALRAHKSSTGASWPELAKAIGIAPSTMGVFGSGNYPVDSARHLVERVEAYLQLLEERRALITQPAFVLTSITRRIYSLIKQCVLLSKIGVIACESGTGKSRSLEEYHATHVNSVLLRANRTFHPTVAHTASASSPFTTLFQVAKALGCSNLSSSRAQTLLYDAIIAAARGSNKVLIIDEAHFLPAEALDVIRTINEDAHIPIILAGHVGLYDRAPRDAESAIAYRSRALRERIKTSSIRQSDVDLIATQIVGVDVANDAQKVLLREAQSSGGLRRLVTILQVAQTYRRGDEVVSKAHVLKAIEERADDGGAL
jgi:DNA transposition AAA+ family ATPase